MSIWKRMGRALAALGGPIGGLLGAPAEDATADEAGAASEDDDHHPVAFTIGMIALGAKMAKADGVVTDDEISAFRQIVQIPEGEVASVSRIFNLAKRDIAGFDAYARQLAGLFADRPGVLEDVMEGLFHIAKADGIVHPSELAYLEAVARIFGFSERAFEGIKTRHVAPHEGDPYVILGLDRSASNDDIKKAYRQLARENHPDALVGRGVPEEFVAIATQKLVRINEAYSQVAAERGL